MKKVLFRTGLVVLAIVAVLGITGGIVSAAGPAEPSILDKVNLIISKLDNADFGLSAIKSGINAIISRLDDGTNGLAAIKNEAVAVNDELDDISVTQTGNGLKTVAGGQTDTLVSVSTSGVAHVSLTIFAASFTDEDVVRLARYFYEPGSGFPGNNAVHYASLTGRLLSAEGDTTAPGAKVITIEFDTVQLAAAGRAWGIEVTNNTAQGSGDMLVGYNYTMTYLKP